ncbi:hypothetical protein N7489_005013 [Penicillium chrysogenum]|uniref:Uncharacterized protein n=1 Tax=Penicillium chrysogenum TaxID=5076 RepID=A0ABQ8WDU1_PENCH|nr:uncharacterized protein N7489_005013 [Penicillium chrysogenum]KAJ5244917.1 hypothetical protein N7489_005013 [Penicillium chrysogenum]KAJ5264720.1 hypothetical protein N7505_007513 [Penicillium chrysogenum]
MANSNGYVVLRQAVSASVASKLADDFQNGLIHNVPTATKDKYNEYKVPQTGFEIKDEFLRVSITHSVSMLALAERSEYGQRFSRSVILSKPNSFLATDRESWHVPRDRCRPNEVDDSWTENIRHHRNYEAIAVKWVVYILRRVSPT